MIRVRIKKGDFELDIHLEVAPVKVVRLLVTIVHFVFLLGGGTTWTSLPVA